MKIIKEEVAKLTERDASPEVEIFINYGELADATGEDPESTLESLGEDFHNIQGVGLPTADTTTEYISIRVDDYNQFLTAMEEVSHYSREEIAAAIESD